ncbi:hypothetical protein BGZ47_010368 [Haplosporangium gracile]|nr:hypothetical protein BGZ47_010368 [Haplosporangium gracile]
MHSTLTVTNDTLEHIDPRDTNDVFGSTTLALKKNDSLRSPLGMSDQDGSLGPLLAVYHVSIDVFPENVPKPVINTDLPRPQQRIERTDQLVYCNNLLLQDSLSLLRAKKVPILNKAELVWLAEIKYELMEQDRLQSIATRMVDKFIQEGIKDSIEIAKIVALGPILQKKPYRKLLSSFIKEFDNSCLLDVDLLQGLVQLVQSVSSGCLISDDLIKIRSILRIRLQDTSLSGLKGCNAPYLMYQAWRAYQALQYVPSNETVFQAVFRYSRGVVDGVVKITALGKLDQGLVLEGLGNLQEALNGMMGVGGTVCKGISFLMSGQGVMERLKERYGASQRTWYAAIRAAYALAEAGQLKDLNRMICEAPCRRDPLFQWRVCPRCWSVASRQQAIELLGRLYKDDPEWGRDESIKAWTLTIIDKLGSIDDQEVAGSALALKQELALGNTPTTYHPYPLRSRLLIPMTSPILTKVQAIPDLDDELFPLLEKVMGFHASDRQVMLILSDSGSGKSSFNRHLEHLLWKDYKRDGPTHLFINLPAIDKPQHDMVNKQLQSHNFDEDQIMELKLSQYLGPSYQDRFKPLSVDRYKSTLQSIFEEAVIAPFFMEQIHNYVEQYVPLEPRTWSTQDYMDKLTTISNLMDLVKNPFLLLLALEVLPHVVKGHQDLSTIKIVRIQLYDTFVNHWLNVNKRRLRSNPLSKQDSDMMEMLEEAEFEEMGVNYSTRLALAMFENQNGKAVVQYIHLKDKTKWKAEYFGPDPEVRLLREASQLTRSGSFFQFLHRSMLEYFFPCAVVSPSRLETADKCSPQSTSDVSQARRGSFRRTV